MERYAWKKDQICSHNNDLRGPPFGPVMIKISCLSGSQWLASTMLFIASRDDDQNSRSRQKCQTWAAIKTRNILLTESFRLLDLAYVQAGEHARTHMHAQARTHQPVWPQSHQQKEMTTSFSWSWSLSPPSDKKLLARERLTGRNVCDDPPHPPIHPPATPPPPT